MIGVREWNQLCNALMACSGYNIGGDRYLPLHNVLSILSGYTEVPITFTLQGEVLTCRVLNETTETKNENIPS